MKKKKKKKKIQQNLRIEFTKNDDPFKNKIFADPWFDEQKIGFNDTNIDEIADIQYNQLPSRVERWKQEVSGQTINLTIQHQLIISEIARCEGSFHFPSPKENPIKGLINIQNKDNKCFRWYLVSYLRLVNINPVKLEKLTNNLQNNLVLKA